MFCDKCHKLEWIWETPESEEREKLDGKCINCWKIVENHSLELKEKMK